MNKNYGNIKDISIIEIVSQITFQEFWHFKKDDIEICRDCEFRYMCLDCRCFIQDKKNNFSKPCKCNYNPYECNWN